MSQKRIYLATTNPNKVKEIRSIVERVVGEVRVEIAKNPRKVEIQADELNSVVAYAASVLSAFNEERPIILEDSGLFIEALNGFPGPYSNYVYKTLGVRGILKLMENERNRSAYFKCAAACVCPNNEIMISEGKVEGTITREPRGTKGFGFDPIFVPSGYDVTFAEMDFETKNEVSHRYRAIKNLLLRMRNAGYI